MSNISHFILLSGGIDSTVVLADVVDRYGADDVTVLWVNYGQRAANRELEAVKAIAEWYGVKLQKVAIVPPLSTMIEIPEGRYEDVDVVNTGLYVPARNLIFIALGARFAFPHGVVYTGIHGKDSPYADVKKEFAEAVDQAVRLGTYNGVRVESPLVDMTKVEIIRKGAELEVPFQLTYSCYRGWENHCGACPTCRQRKDAFRAAGVEDPTVYEK